jgi:acetaldehyde dehydrogenase (acetylating)
MHLDLVLRRRAMPRVAGLLRSGGVMIASLRHGPVPPGRRMFEVTTAETVDLGRAAGLSVVLTLEGQDGLLRRPGVTWTRLAFSKSASVA